MNESALKQILRYTLFPLTMAITVGLSYLGAYMLDQALFGFVLSVVVAFSICMIMERVLPYRSNWLKNQGDTLPDAQYLLINAGLNEFAHRLGLAGLIAALALFAYEPEGLITRALWPTHWNPFLQLILAIVVLEFGEYWFHRFAHRIGFLWRFHSIHHSPKRLYFFNAFRFHPLEMAALSLVKVLPLFLIGLDAEIILLHQAYVICHALFQHGNIDVKLGLLNYYCSGPELHRWHHSQVIEESDRNFGNNTIVWDLVFGTYFLPRDREVGKLGLLNPEFPSGYLEQTMASFRKKPLDKPKDYYERPEYYEEMARGS